MCVFILLLLFMFPSWLCKLWRSHPECQCTCVRYSEAEWLFGLQHGNSGWDGWMHWSQHWHDNVNIYLTWILVMLVFHRNTLLKNECFPTFFVAVVHDILCLWVYNYNCFLFHCFNIYISKIWRDKTRLSCKKSWKPLIKSYFYFLLWRVSIKDITKTSSCLLSTTLNHLQLCRF